MCVGDVCVSPVLRVQFFFVLLVRILQKNRVMELP